MTADRRLIEDFIPICEIKIAQPDASQLRLVAQALAGRARIPKNKPQLIPCWLLGND
jgi:hypothetical protein